MENVRKCLVPHFSSDLGLTYTDNPAQLSLLAIRRVLHEHEQKCDSQAENNCGGRLF